MKQGIVLFGHGSRQVEWAAPFHAIRREIEGLQADAEVELAFLELMQPSLGEAIAALLAREVEAIVIVPVFISSGNHLREDLPRLVQTAEAHHPGLRITVAAALGEAPQMLTAIARYALTAEPQKV